MLASAQDEPIQIQFSLALFLLNKNLAGVWIRRAKLSTNTNRYINNMNTLHIKGDWNIAKGKLKQKYGQLTDNDLRFVEGQEDELIGRIQKRTGDTKEAVEQFLDECYKN